MKGLKSDFKNWDIKYSMGDNLEKKGRNIYEIIRAHVSF